MNQEAEKDRVKIVWLIKTIKLERNISLIECVLFNNNDTTTTNDCFLFKIGYKRITCNYQKYV